MATYKITLEIEIVLSVNGKRVKREVTRNTQTLTGVFADVAKVMYQHEVNCIMHNTLPKLTKDVYTCYQSKDSLQLTQISERIG